MKEHKTVYKQGKQRKLTYHENGKPKSEEYYKNSFPYGQWNEYYENGIIKQATFYNHSEKPELIRYYDKFGVLERVEKAE